MRIHVNGYNKNT